MTAPKNLWQRLDGPLKIGITFAVLGIILTLIGIFRDPTTPVTAWSIFMGTLIAGGVWGVVSWAIATAAVEVEDDVQQAQLESENLLLSLVSQTMTRSNVIITGLIGLVAGIFLTALCLYIMIAEYIPVVLARPLFVWGLFFFLLFFSLAEIPVMVYGIRSIAANNNPRAKNIALVTNSGYVFFAAFYAVPFILLAGSSTLTLMAGTFLASLCFVRFITSVIFLPDHAKQQI